MNSLKETTIQSIRELQSIYPEKRSALIPALHLAQADIGYLPQEIQKEVADLFDLDTNEVTALVTFYEMFHEKPEGNHLIHVCVNLSCMLHGSDSLLNKICCHLNTVPHQTTEDGQFTVIPTECLAACDRAPMMLVDDTVYGPVKEEDIAKIVEETRKKCGHVSPVEFTVRSHA